MFTKFTFWEEDWALNYNSMKLWNFPDISQFPEIASIQLFGNSWGNSCIRLYLLITTLHFTWSERKTWKNIKKFQNIMTMIDCNILFRILLSLMIAPNAKNSHILVGKYFFFPKKSPRPNLKVFQYQIWTSMITPKK